MFILILKKSIMHAHPNFIKTVSANIDGRDFVVGDLHGCFDELAKLLVHVKFDPSKDRLFSTGDLIDRGPRSTDCISLLTKKWFHAVLGNHEDLMLNKLKMIENNEVEDLTNEEIEYIKDLVKFVPYILDMPLVYEIEHLLHGKIYIVHSEILPEHLFPFSETEMSGVEYDKYADSMKKYDFSNQLENFFINNNKKELNYNLKQKLIWSRKIVGSFYKDHREDIEISDFSFLNDNSFSQRIKVFCGHNVVPFPMKIGQQYYIDTGSALGYSSKGINSNLFTQFGHEFFTLSMVDLTTGICYGCISSTENRGKVLKLEKSLYEM